MRCFIQFLDDEENKEAKQELVDSIKSAIKDNMKSDPSINSDSEIDIFKVSFIFG